ncbi:MULTISPECIES: effector-associated domain EAD1-containing protein [Frankia]|uniref:effector-associated domain EAD1-containing protein n=1 Tax=Frankia TaxID=1854 RepID=UPI000A7C75FE|nr:MULTISPECIES: effector-associated domain EAD1-containing protein [Frankia]
MADEQPDAEPLTFDEIAELAARFPERDAAVRLLRTAGFPVGRIPSWQPEDAAEFFNAVSQRLGDGILHDGRALLLATAREVSPRPPGHPRSPLDPPYRQLRPGAPEVWLLQPRFGVVPYLGRDGLLHDLESWCVEEIFSVGLVTGEGGSGKTRTRRPASQHHHPVGTASFSNERDRGILTRARPRRAVRRRRARQTFLPTAP